MRAVPAFARFVPAFAAAALLAAPGGALAQPAAPAPAPGPACEVTISRAPDDVRPVIEKWVRAEARCRTSLDVRVVLTEGGLYLLGREPGGRVHERIVPDAQSAGVLVASWIADDSVAAPARGPAAAPVAAVLAPLAVGPAVATAAASTAMAVAPTATAVAPAATPPGSPGAGPAPGLVAVAATAPPVAFASELAELPAGTAPPTARPGARWLTVGSTVLMEGGDGSGLRGELDLVRRGRWALGAMLAGSVTNIDIFTGVSSGAFEIFDLRALASLSHTFQHGRWQLRLQGAAGAALTYARSYYNGLDLSGTVTSPTAEASATLGRELFRHWAISAGPVVSWIPQDLRANDPRMSELILQRDFDVSVFVGVRRRL